MNNKTKTDFLNFFASCPRGLEEVLGREAKEQGIKGKILLGGISFSCDAERAIDLVLNSRIASRVFILMQSFDMKDELDLYKKAKQNWWHKEFTLDQTFKIKTLFDYNANLSFRNSVAVSQKLKDAIVDQYRDEKGKRPDVDTKTPDVSILLRIETKIDENERIKGFHASIYFDMCGEPLSNRGYRPSGHTAPIRENLAAGILMSIDWNPKSEPLIDIMCGTGTFLIEGALMANDIPPSYIRIHRALKNDQTAFDFLKHNWFTKNKMLEAIIKDKIVRLDEDVDKKLDKFHPDDQQFWGSDISGKAIDIAKKTVELSDLPFRMFGLFPKTALSVLPPERTTSGVIICNPPYGERMGTDEELETLYHDLGENLKKNWKGFRAYILTSKPELRKKISLQTSKRIPVWNGSIECRVLEYKLF